MKLSAMAPAFEAACGPMFMVTDQGSVTYANQAASTLLGIGVEDLIGADFRQLLPAAGIDGLLNSKDRAQTSWQVPVFEHTCHRGQQRYLEIRATRGQSDASQDCYIFIVTDVTAMQAELNALKSTVSRWQHVLEGANVGVFEIDLATGKSIVSDTWCALMGIEGEVVESPQKIWMSRLHPEDAKLVQDANTACIEGRTERSNVNYRLRSADDTHWQWMNSNAVVARRAADGTPLALAGAQTDVSQAIDAEHELRISEQQFRSSFENGPIGMAIVGLDGAWLRVNTALCRMFGYSQDSFLQTDFQTLTHPDDLGDDLNHLNRLLSGDIETYQIEKRYCHADGSIIWGMLSVGLVRDAGGKPEHFVSQIVDVTEERRVNELKNEFIATVSHELRTPLTSIIGSLKLVTTQFGDSLPAAIKSLLDIALQNSDRLHGLVLDVLDYERLADGRLSLEASSQPVSRLLDDAVEANLAYITQLGAQVTAKYSDVALTVFLDTTRFQQAMTNLLSNAAKFSDGGGTIEIDAKQEGANVKISVTNTGEHIPESYRPHIFKPFSQAASSAVRKNGGTGLGLSITKKIIEQMGGDIGYESVQGDKTTFWFTLPIARHTALGAAAG